MTPAPAAQTIDARCAAAAMTGSAASSEASGAVSSTGAVERGDGAGPRQYVLSSGEDCCVRVSGRVVERGLCTGGVVGQGAEGMGAQRISQAAAPGSGGTGMQTSEVCCAVADRPDLSGSRLWQTTSHRHASMVEMDGTEQGNTQSTVQ